MESLLSIPVRLGRAKRVLRTPLGRAALFVLLLSFACLQPFFAYGAEPKMHKSHGGQDTTGALAGPKPVLAPMPAPGKKVPVDADHYLVYGFDKKPKLGPAIMKVEVFTADGKKDTSLEIRADSGMPSMGGAHETGERTFTISKKGDYLMPIDIVMPGDWEVRFSVLKEGKVIFRGRYNFDI